MRMQINLFKIKPHKMNEYEQIRTNQTVPLNFHKSSNTLDFEKELVIPPYNSDIRNLHFIKEASVPRELMNPKSFIFKTATQSIPDAFSWSITTPSDSKTVQKKKSLIDGVRDQYLCGSCYAVTLAQIISDCHVVSGAVSWAPNVSATSIMACFAGVRPCNGGSPARLSLAISKSGVMDQTCVDYSWCSEDKKWCTTRAGKNEFSVDYTDKLNENVPKSCGCYFNDSLKFRYSIDAPGVLVHRGLGPVYKTMVKKHILEYGPVIGTFAVYPSFNNFLVHGNHINGGVYFENGRYSRGMQSMAWNKIAGRLIGFHAFSVMGWGIEKNIEHAEGEIGDVPYWHCRNSYGTAFGDEGYFKLAMYPFNSAGGQIDSLFSIGQTGGLGGIILIKCTSPPIEIEPDLLTRNQLKSFKRSHDDQFYKASPEKVRSLFYDETSSVFELKWWMLIPVLVICVIIIMFVCYPRP